MPSSSRPAASLRTAAIAAGASLLVAVSVAVALERVRRRTASRRDGGVDEAKTKRLQRPHHEMSSSQEWIEKFPSLGGAFHSPASSSAREGGGRTDSGTGTTTTTIMVGLLFAAGWCDDCQVFVPLLHKLLDIMRRQHHGGITIVYVSSDASREDMERFKPGDWDAVPFEREQERITLKRHIGACAKKELQDAALGMTAEDRRHGIPMLVLIEPTTGRVVAENGVELVTDAMRETADNSSSSVSKVALDRFWTKVSLLQEQ